jgi:hypothetical protein
MDYLERINSDLAKFDGIWVECEDLLHISLSLDECVELCNLYMLAEQEKSQ